MVRQMIDVLDRRLYRFGFSHGDARQMVRNQLLVGFFASAAALAAAWGSPWGWAFAAGTVLATANFWWLARYGQRALLGGGVQIVTTVFWFYARLAGSTVALYVLIVWAQAPVWAVLAGVSTVLATLFAWGLLKGARTKRAKEA